MLEQLLLPSAEDAPGVSGSEPISEGSEPSSGPRYLHEAEHLETAALCKLSSGKAPLQNSEWCVAPDVTL